jgi:outer membrane lipoprotein-sorting protein
MRRRVSIGLSLAAVAAILLVIAAVAGGRDTLPSLTAGELLARMSAADGQSRAISGEVSWTNHLLGDLAVPSQYDRRAAQTPLAADGGGRVWLASGGLRLESQASGGDQVIVLSAAKRKAWVYDYATDRVKVWRVTGGEEQPLAVPSPSPSMLTPSQIDQFVRQAAPYAAVSVAGQATVAGRDAYVLRLTPAATDTALGAIDVAVDGETYVPLRLQVFAATGGDAVVSFGFDSISYDAIDPSLFSFEPPGGAKVTTSEIDAAALRDERDAAKGGEAGSHDGPDEGIVRRALLTADQAQELVGFDLASARGYAARPFRWAYVLDEGGPLTVGGTPLAQLLGMGSGMGARPDGATGGEAGTDILSGPVAVLLYGKGFGAIALAETKTTPELTAQLEQVPQLADTTTVGGARARILATPLGGAVVWQEGGRTLAAFGLVTRADLEGFATTVR